MYSTIAAAALLALAPSALAGSLTVNNHCSQNVYMFANQGFNETSDMMTLTPGGTPYNVPYAGQSIVLKMHSDPDPGSINSELEYSVVGNTIFYDLSNILGLPQLFQQGGMSVIPSDSSCQALNCVPGASSCAGAYVNSDDPDTLSCGANSDLVVNLCTSNQGSSAPASSSSAPSSSAPPPPPASSAAPAPASAVAPVVNAAVNAAPSSKAPAPAPAPAPTTKAAPAPSPPAVAAVAPAAAPAAASGHPLIVNPNGMISAQGLSDTASKNVEEAAEKPSNVAVVTTFTTLYTRGEATAAAPLQRRHVHHHHHNFHADEE